MDLLTLGLLIAAVIILIGITVVIISIRVFRSEYVSTRIQDFVVSPNATGYVRAEIQATPDVLQGNIFSRTIVPWVMKIAAFFGKFGAAASSEQLNWKLSIIKNPLKLRALEFNGLRIVVLLLGLILGLLLNLPDRFTNRLALLGGVTIVFFFALLPEAWLSGQVRKAQDEARSGLPDALDMLSVCAFAGLGFDQSLQRVSDYWQTTLGNEFRRVVNEIELGVTRADALRSLANRLRIPELTTFVAIIIQAESLGMRTADVLHGQAEQMRILRQFRAKEVANKLPAKMIVPLAFLILPALFAVIFSPMVPSLLALFGGF